MNKKSAIVTIKITPNMNTAINKYVIKDTHMNRSEFIRSAIREKILRDAPHLIDMKEK